MTQQLRHAPSGTRRRRQAEVRIVEIRGQQRRLRDDLGAIPVEVDHAAGTSPSPCPTTATRNPSVYDSTTAFCSVTSSPPMVGPSRCHALIATALRKLPPVAISDDDLDRLGRCVEPPGTALEDGDEPFGSILVDGPAPGYADTMKSLYESKFRP
jgi:hypothetical protein